jgi:hypothetical protein
MKQQFVPYEIAVMLKEKGFDEPCLGYYTQYTGTEVENHLSYVSNHISENHNSNITTPPWYTGVDVTAPLWQQVIDWFREKHNLIMWVEARYCFKKKYFWFIHFDVLIKDDIFDLHIETYEEARQAVIEHALTLI